MSQIPPTPEIDPEHKKLHPSRILLRGLAIALPPILTVVILIWIFGGINHYIIQPTSTVVRYCFAQFIEDSVKSDSLTPWEKLPPLEYCQTNYRITPELKKRLQKQLETTAQEQGSTRVTVDVKTEWVLSESEQVYVTMGSRAVPYEDYKDVASVIPASSMPATSIGIYMELVTIRYFQSIFHLSAVAVIITIVSLYFIGRVVTVQLGQWTVNAFENRVLSKVPVISNVYSSVKQVTDFLFTERTVSYNQVVAVQYPREGIWSLGFVTGQGMREVAEELNEPMLALLMPTSPMPMTGFTIMVPKSECIELDLTVDQAFQYCLSCGVLVPPQQKISPEAFSAAIVASLPENQGNDTESSSDEGPGEDEELQ
ncbi:MAG: DUF502 domain-containing protein [Planctomycetaceae bacterium]|nr:DUF502 domain-containing protein [Planctomycetaceae bacterium]